MFYTSKQLSSSDVCLQNNAYLEYLYLYRHKKSTFHSLCPHEKDYFFSRIEASIGDSKILNLYSEEEAYEYIFYSIIVAYKQGVLCFEDKSVCQIHNNIHRKLNEDISFFNFFYRFWVNRVDTGKGKYMQEISSCIAKKIDEIQSKRYSEEEYVIREKQCYIMFFFVYYKAKLYFEELGNKCIVFTANEFTFVATALTYCHILSRHYFPLFNGSSDATFNEDVLFDDCKDMLENIKELIISHMKLVQNIKFNKNTARLLFKKKGQNYIMWLKRKRMSILSNNEGIEVCTFFRFDDRNNKYLDFLKNTKDVKLVDDWYGCVENN